MDSLSFLNTIPFSTLKPPPPPRSKPHSLHPKLPLLSTPTLTTPRALKNPRGFGPPTKNTKTRKKTQTSKDNDNDDDDDDEDDGREDDDVAIPEVVTNRMMKRMGLSVGIPLSVGLLFFPFFYYLKVVAKVDVPNWVPFVVSFAFFGIALLGVSYGIVSASWDPLREGSLLGWNEARRNWPVFWESLWGGGRKK